MLLTVLARFYLAKHEHETSFIIPDGWHQATSIFFGKEMKMKTERASERVDDVEVMQMS